MSAYVALPSYFFLRDTSGYGLFVACTGFYCLYMYCILTIHNYVQNVKDII